jgi:pyruvate dehydrogenase (quinone)
MRENPMANEVSDFLVNRMMEWDVDRIYGIPGDGINGFFGALARAERSNEPIQLLCPTHEEEAAFMAVANAKFTDGVGVCCATSGPGAVHLLNGLYDAKLDNQPVVAIVGQQPQSAIGSMYQQELNLSRLFADVAEYVEMISTPVQAQVVLDRAFRTAHAERAPTCVIIPNDVQKMEFEEPERAEYVSRSGVGAPSSQITPPQAELEKAADILNAGETVAMLVGQGALHATDEIITVAEKTGAGVAKSLLGKAAVPDDVPFVTGCLGLLGTRPSSDMMEECDTLLMIGTNFPYSEYLPEGGQARGIQIDIDAEHLSLRYPMELNLIGDSKATLSALLPLLDQQEDVSWQRGIEEDVETWSEVIEAQAMVSADPINPQRVYHELSPKLPDNAIITADAGTTADWYSRYIEMQRGMMGNLSGRIASMIPAMPYAIAAKFAHPERPVVCTIGDGAMQMLGNNGLITVSRYWQKWDNPTFIILVLHNDDLNHVSWEMRAKDGIPKYETSQEIQDFSYAQYAKLLGLGGVRVDDPDILSKAWDAAFDADKPVVLDVITDPHVPPLPPHIDFEQASNFTKAILKRDPDGLKVIKASMKQMAASAIQRRKNKNE